jgi:hypothetical protein
MNMPIKASPLVKIAKKLEALQAKSVKLSSDIAELNSLVIEEVQKEASAPLPEVKAPSAKLTAKVSAKNEDATIVSFEPKKRGRPAGVSKVVKADDSIAKTRGRPKK